MTCVAGRKFLREVLNCPKLLPGFWTVFDWARSGSRGLLRSFIGVDRFKSANELADCSIRTRYEQRVRMQSECYAVQHSRYCTDFHIDFWPPLIFLVGF